MILSVEKTKASENEERCNNTYLVGFCIETKEVISTQEST